MNERIRELALKAGMKHPVMGEKCYASFSYEEFAELIVQECIDIAYDYDAPKMSGPGMIIGNRIEEHFGVEE